MCRPASRLMSRRHPWKKGRAPLRPRPPTWPARRPAALRQNLRKPRNRAMSMTKKTIHLVAAARPNFMKVAPLYHRLRGEDWCAPVLVHTGQHYDPEMSDVFFRDLDLPQPDFHLGIGGGSHAEQVGKVMIAYEALLGRGAPDLVTVVGDVNA